MARSCSFVGAALHSTALRPLSLALLQSEICAVVPGVWGESCQRSTVSRLPDNPWQRPNVDWRRYYMLGLWQRSL